MNVAEILEGSRDLITVKRVFGEPYESDGTTVIPAAKVQGGGGGGEGEGPSDEGEGTARGSGSGYGVSARPAGAYVITDGDVIWKPALDWNRVILGTQVLTGLAILAFAVRRLRRD